MLWKEAGITSRRTILNSNIFKTSHSQESSLTQMELKKIRNTCNGHQLLMNESELISNMWECQDMITLNYSQNCWNRKAFLRYQMWVEHLFSSFLICLSKVMSCLISCFQRELVFKWNISSKSYMRCLLKFYLIIQTLPRIYFAFGSLKLWIKR